MRLEGPRVVGTGNEGRHEGGCHDVGNAKKQGQAPSEGMALLLQYDPQAVERGENNQKAEEKEKFVHADEGGWGADVPAVRLR